MVKYTTHIYEVNHDELMEAVKEVILRKYPGASEHLNNASANQWVEAEDKEGSLSVTKELKMNLFVQTDDT